MKIRDYSFEHGVFNIKAEIHLEFPRKYTMEGGYFCLKNKNADARKCFQESFQHTDLKEFLNLINKYSKEFVEKVPDDKITHLKEILVQYHSNSAAFGSLGESNSVDLEFQFKVVETFWNGKILLKALNVKGDTIPLQYGRIIKEDYVLIPYSEEAEKFLQDIANKLTHGISKLEEFFTNDPFDRKPMSLSDKIKLAVESQQKLLE